MYYQGYQVTIPEGKEGLGGYVNLNHKQKYRITIANLNHTICDAIVAIDGKEIGTFRLNAFQTATIERPVHDRGRFTALRKKSKEANRAGLNSVSDNDLGLISVKFIPEKKREPIYTSGPWASPQQWPQQYNPYDVKYKSRLDSEIVCSSRLMNYCSSPGGSSAGGTGLTGVSSQDYINTYNIELDNSKAVTVYLRIAINDADYTGVRPLVGINSGVPAPIH